MSPWDEMKAYVGFGDDDARRLAVLAPFVEQERTRILDRFYATLLRFPGSRAVLSEEQQVHRLKATLGVWLGELLRGPHDEAYCERRKRIGYTHVRVGLPERYMFTAMSLIREDLVDIALERISVPERLGTIRAISKVTDLDLAVMVSAYWESHEKEELRSLRDLIVLHLPLTVLCLDADGRVTAATRPAARVFESTASVGRHYTEFLPRQLLEDADLESRVGEALATGREISLPSVAVGSGADQRHVRLDLVPLEHPLARLLLHVEDLSEVVQAEARARQAEALARIGALAANVAHEIRNPLTAISTTLQVIETSLAAPDSRRQILAKVREQVFRLDRLVTDLLGYARPTRPEITCLDLGAVAKTAIGEAAAGAALVDEGAAPAMGDPALVRQVLVNLLQNARDAAGPTGRVELRIGPGPRARVVDDGPGIHPEVAGRLFEPFVTTKAKGTGLGLAISRKLVESMSGEVTCEPSAHGAVFLVQLPEATTEVPASPADTEGHSG